MDPTTRDPDLINAMKVHFAGPLYRAVVTRVAFMKLIKRSGDVQVDKTTGGRYVEKAMQTRLGGGAGSRAERDYIPEARSPKYINPRITLPKHVVTVNTTGDALRLVRGDKESFITWARDIMTDASERHANNMNRQFIGTGSGIMAKVATKGADFITVTAPFGVTGWTDAWLQFLEGDSLVFTSDAAGTTIRNAAGVRYAVVANIEEATGKLFLESADGTAVDAALLAAITVGDFIFAGDSAGISAPKAGKNREMEGVLAAVDDGGIVPTYHNIPRAGQRYMQGNVSNVAGPFTEDVAVDGAQLVRVRGGGNIDHIVLSFAAAKQYWKDQKGGNRFLDARGNFTGGMGKLGVVVGDRELGFNIAESLPPQLAFGLELGTFERYSPGEVTWDDSTGAVWRPVTDATGRLDELYALAVLYENLHCNAPRKNIRWEGLQDAP